MKFPADQKFFIPDCESIGLHGQTFAVAAGIYDLQGNAVPDSESVFYCQPGRANPASPTLEPEDRSWVAVNVEIPTGAVHCDNPAEVRWRFWQKWSAAKKAHPGILFFVECGWPVEARFLIECIQDDPVTRNWEGPYPMHEIATMMLAAGMDPMATYDRLPHELPAHDPLADIRLSARLLSEALSRLNDAEQICYGEGQGVGILHFVAK